MLFRFVPVLFVIVPISLVLAFRKKNTGFGIISIVFFLCTVLLVAVSLVVPNFGGKQWGPRYLLILVPPLCLACGIIIQWALKESNRFLKYACPAVIVGLAIFGAYHNTYYGTKNLIDNYKYRMKPALDYLRGDTTPIVAVNQHYIARGLTADYDNKAFFLVRTEEELGRFASLALKHGHTRFLYIAQPKDKLPKKFKFGPSRSPVSEVILKRLMKKRMLVIYDAKIVRV